MLQVFVTHSFIIYRETEQEDRIKSLKNVLKVCLRVLVTVKQPRVVKIHSVCSAIYPVPYIWKALQ
jgi:hypothetical protein